MKVENAVRAMLVIAALLGLSNPAAATLALNPVGTGFGFSLTTFVSGYNFGNYGPLAEGILPNGRVVTGSLGNDTIYTFNDVDNQTLADAVTATPYTLTTGNPHYAMATAGGQVYGAQLFGGGFEQFFNDGSHSLLGGPVSTQQNYLGMWGDPVNGHVIAMSYQNGLIDINPLTGTYRVVNGGVLGDGLTVSPDGNTIYVEQSGGIASYAMSDGHFINFYFFGHGPDGTGVITGGLFNGDIIVNNNDGTLGLLDPTTSIYTEIASGGSRGDFVSADTNNGTLFISQIENVMRLSCGPGCTIGSPALPEPGMLPMFGLALAGLAFARRRKRVQ